MLYEDYEGSRSEFLKLMAEQGEEPAFVRRSRGLEAALESLRRECRNQRRVMLHGPRMHLRMIAASIGGRWDRLGKFLKNAIQWPVFEELFETWNKESPAPSWSGAGQLHQVSKRTVHEFYSSVDRFNVLWNKHLLAFDLAPINRVIEGYNEHYVLEKACAFGSEEIAQKGFEPQGLMTVANLQSEFPPITLPDRK